MGTIETKDKQHGQKVKLHYCDWGTGKPVILIHGWPSTSQMWEYQLAELANAGFRVIAYDRRGFGRSSVPYKAYDYDTLASDLNAVIEELDLKEVTLVGFSMGGGEVVRYLSRYGAGRISKAVLISAVTPFLNKTPDNPNGVPTEVFEQITAGLKKDRADFLEGFGKDFFGVSMLNHPVSEAYLRFFHTLSMLSSSHATLECAAAFAYTDFRLDLPAVTVPTLIIHGDADKTVPIEVSGNRTAQAIPHAQYIVYEGAPHGLFFTHKDRLNADLISFINQDTPGAAMV
jgi:pimeloyl-ACP methyl ester carboxylesterase